MLVLHGLWGGKGFFIWGETDAIYSIKKRGRPSKVTGEIPHPFQASPAALTEAINSICPGAKWERHSWIESRWLILPSDKYAPQGSPWLSMEENQYQHQSSRWQIQGIVLPAPVFMEEIVPVYEEGHIMDTNGIVVGDDWRYWILCNRFLLKLLCSQKFIPYFKKAKGGHIEAIWQPVVEEPEDRYFLNELIKRMPPICCSLIRDLEFPFQISLSDDIFIDFLYTATHQMINHWLVDIGEAEEQAPIERKWLCALHGKNNEVKGSHGELGELIEGLKEWTSPLRQNSENFRLCFKLEEPRYHQEWWHLSFYLQAIDNPNILVPAREVWANKGEAAIFFGRSFEHHQERVLEGLGKALKIFPPLERSLFFSCPEGCDLSLEEAYSFLRQTSLALQENGFGVLAPDWWRERKKFGPRVRMKVRPVSNKDSSLGLNSLVEYEWQLVIGNQVVDYQEIKKICGMKRMLKRIGDQWIEINPHQIQHIIQWLEKKGRGGVLQLGEALDMFGEKEEESFHEMDGEGWLDILLKGAAGMEPFTIRESPVGFSGHLRPYQIRGYSWLLFLRQRGFGACLADDMGLGKTVQLLAMLLYERERLGVEGPTLIICPTSVVGNWQREAAKFVPDLKIFVYHGESRPSSIEFQEIVEDYDIVISTYSLALREKELFSRIFWRGIVLDEAQNIKNPGAKQTKAVRSFKADYRIALTGTPVENRLRDLWSILEFINPGYLGKWESFRLKFAIPIEKYGDDQKAEQLRMLTRPFILRRLKTDTDIIQDLPEKQEMKVYCSLTQEQSILYQKIVEELVDSIDNLDGIRRKGRVLAALTQLKQICNHPAQYLGDGEPDKGRSGKLIRLVEMLEEVLEEGDRALVFTQYAKMGKMIQRCLKRHFKCDVPFLHGGVSRSVREEMIKKFQEKEGPSVFVLSLKAGGVGLNLTHANHVFHYDRWWNPAVENQATDRVFRIGQRKNVQVHTFICSGTLEEKIDMLIEQKKDLAEQVVGSGEGWLTELDNQKIRELFALEAVSILDKG